MLDYIVCFIADLFNYTPLELFFYDFIVLFDDVGVGFHSVN